MVRLHSECESDMGFDALGKKTGKSVSRFTAFLADQGPSYLQGTHGLVHFYVSTDALPQKNNNSTMTPICSFLPRTENTSTTEKKP